MRSVIISLLASSAVATTTKWLPKFENLVAFGDSYTDESRLSYFQNNGGRGPPAGTLLPASNSTAGGGITWPRFVSQQSGAKLYNYAVSGAVCDNKIIYRYLDSIKGPFPDVVYEVNAFIADTKYVNRTTKTNTLYTNRKSDNTAYAMWIGTNDLGAGAFLTDSSLGGKTIPDYVDCIFDKFDKIYKNGGRYFVLFNTAPLELSPLYGTPESGGLAASKYWTDKPANISEASGKMKEYTKLVNDIFDYRTPFELQIAKRYPGAKFAVFDVNSLITDIYNHPERYLTAPANVNGVYQLCGLDWSNCVNSKLSLDHFLWFDELHPSQRTDEIIAKEFVRVVKGGSRYATYW